MKAYSDIAQKKKRHSAAKAIAYKQSNPLDSTLQYVGNRPEAIAQRKLQKTIKNSPQVKQFRRYQEISNNSPQVKKAAQLQAIANNSPSPQVIQKKQNDTGLPDKLKSGIENLSGLDMSDTKVHYNSSKPAQLQAHAYAQGTDIYLASGQEKHLSHEAWHVVQQKQGRVRPTLQMRGKVNINDDNALENEADLMGAKALQLKLHEADHVDESAAYNNPGNTIQRVIILGTRGLTSQKAYNELTALDSGFEKYEAELLRGILPAYNVNGESFLDIKELARVVNSILKVYAVLFNDYSSFADYLHNQRLSQTAVKANPGRFKSMVTTLGFEHEFADMKNSPLAGVSHMKVAKSTVGLPFTGIKFLVETDADNALELVSPPFLFPTVKGSTVPFSYQVSAIDVLMKSTLYRILTEKNKAWLPDVYYNRKYVNQTLEQLMAKLSAATGFTFQLKNNIEIKPGYLSHKTDLNTLKDHVALDPVHPNKLKFNQNSLKNIQVGQSIKGESSSYSISSQVNFATDIASTAKLQNLGKPIGDDPIFSHPIHSNFSDDDLYKRIDEGLRTHIPVPAPGSPGLAAFYPILIGKLAGLFSVYSQDHVRNAQTELHADLVAKATPAAADRNQGLPSAGARKQFEIHADKMSFVKDRTSAWIKDHAISLVKGMLIPTDYPSLLAALKANSVSGFAIPANIDTYLQAEGHASIAAHWQHFIAEVETAISMLEINIEHLIIPRGSAAEMDFKPNVGLYGHHRLFLGARQDTYQDPEKVQLPEIHPNKRLHVVEIRRGDPSKKLSELEKDI